MEMRTGKARAARAGAVTGRGESGQPAAGAEKERSAIEHALRERVKELRCLYGISQLMERNEDSLPRFMQGVAHMLPAAWQFPECACARVRYGDKEYETPGFRESPHRQAADILVNGRKAGVVEVYYTKRMPRADEGPFLKEERDLINGIARKLGTSAQRILAEEELRRTHAQLQVERRALQEANTALRIVLSRIEDEKSVIKEAVVGNVNKIIVPILHALETEVEEDKKGYVRLLRRNLEEIASPLQDQLSRRFMALTPAELKVCNMIQMGLGTKEMARLRHISPATVNRQRENIRRKLGLTGKSVNLVTYLQTFNKDLQKSARIGRFGLDSLAETDSAPAGSPLPPAVAKRNP